MSNYREGKNGRKRKIESAVLEESTRTQYGESQTRSLLTLYRMQTEHAQ
jgi:hypothetical protein